MLKINKQQSKIFITCSLLAICFIATACGVYSLLKPRHNAQAGVVGFRAGNIMSDFVMSNKATMTEADIQKFLKSKNPCNDTNLSKKNGYEHLGYTIKDGHFVCMADEDFNGESAAHIIFQAAQDYNINPQVLIVLLEKEQSLVTDTWPNHRQYATATGFACPDTGSGCDPLNNGFKNQVRKAAELFHEVLSGGWSNYPAYTTQKILYHPNSACGSSMVYIENRATSALYRYTPYQPNQAALNAGTGIGDSCSSYGNRNFYNLFTKWFGSTQSAYDIHGGIYDGYIEAGGEKTLGKPIMNESCGLVKGGCYQKFENGVVYWSNSTGGHAITGKIFDRWFEIGYEYSVLGYPTKLAVKGLKDNGSYQQFENGVIYYSPKTGAFENYGNIRNTYEKNGFENGFLGYPIGKQGCGLRLNGCYQHYQGGSIYWNPTHGGMTIYGAIQNKWFNLGFENSVVGYPSGTEVCLNGYTCYRDFEKGSIYWYAGTLAYENHGEIAKKYREMGRGQTFMGYPTMDQKCGLYNDGCYQTLQYNGTIYWSPKSGAHVLYGGIRQAWIQTGYEWGSLGYPTSDEISLGNGNTYQRFERGEIHWINGAPVTKHY